MKAKHKCPENSNADVNSDHISAGSFPKGLRISVDTQPKQTPFIRREVLRIDQFL